MIRIAHIITGLSTGGAETALYRLLSRADQSRFQPIVISLIDEGTIGPLIRGLQVEVITLGLNRPLTATVGLWRLISVLRRKKPDIVQTWLYHADLLGTLAAKLAGSPAIIWNIRCSDMDLTRYPLGTRIIRRILAQLSSLPDVVIANSHAGKNYHERQLQYHPRQWEVIGNGFDLDRFRPDPLVAAEVRTTLGIAADTPVIGMVARFDPMKDHVTFFRAAAILAKDQQQTHFVLAGRGVDERNTTLIALARGLGLEKRVHLLGERADVQRLMASFDIATLSSRFGEGFPNVLGEAMACGVPCVATDIGDCALVVGETGRMVPPHDPAALARAWNELLDMGPEQRQRLGSAARRRVTENFSTHIVTHRYQALYQRVYDQTKPQ